MRKKIGLFIVLLLYTAFVYATALLFFACMVKCIRMGYIDSVIVISCIFILTITVFLYKITDQSDFYIIYQKEMKKEKSEWTDEELAKKLDEVFDKNSSVLRLPSGREINDNEAMHEDADLLLIEFLKQLGYEKTVEKYYEMKKYFRYA